MMRKCRIYNIEMRRERSRQNRFIMIYCKIKKRWCYAKNEKVRSHAYTVFGPVYYALSVFGDERTDK